MQNFIRHIQSVLRFAPSQPVIQRCNYANNYYGDQVCRNAIQQSNDSR